MLNKRFILTMVFGFLCISTTSWADIVFFKNGQTFEGTVVENENGLWIDGVKFELNEIERIEKKDVKLEKVSERERIEYLERLEKSTQALQAEHAKRRNRIHKSKLKKKEVEDLKAKINEMKAKNQSSSMSSNKGSGYKY